MNTISEKRSYYRINDVVGLSYMLLDGDKQPSPQSPVDLDIPLGNLLAELDRKFNQAANTLWQESPTTANALGILNRKLSIIASRTLSEEYQDVAPYEELMVSISGSGIGFHCPEEFPEGARLRLSIALRPSNINLNVTGVITGCEHDGNTPERPYWVRIRFDEGNDAAQELLIQHIVQRQCAQIGESAED